VKPLLILAAGVVLLAAPPAVTAPFELERLPPGPLPGKRIGGQFRVPGPESVRGVRELAVAGRTGTRTALLIARGRQDQLCLAVAVGASVRRATFRCLASLDHPPMLVRVGVGGNSRAKTDWLSVVGLVRREVKRVTLESDRFRNKDAELREWPGFPWKAFAVPPAGEDEPYTVRARDGSRAVLQRIELSWASNAPCQETPKGCKTGAERRGRWSEARDPIAEAQGPFTNGKGGSRSKRLATDHPVVRQLIAGQAFSIEPVTLWRRCNGRLNGAVVPIRLSTPVTFEADVPVHGDSKKTAYTEGVAHLRVEHGVFFRIYVDLNRDKVVGIYPEDDGLDGRDGGRPKPNFDIKLLGELRPAGGPDSGNCEPKPGA
jgi:hypothetical protein